MKNSEKLVLIALGISLLALTSPPPASADRLYEENVVMTSISETVTDAQSRITGEDSILIRGAIDNEYGNLDGELTQAELDNYENALENMELEKMETEYTFIDGRNGHIEEVDFEVAGPLGDTMAPGDLIYTWHEVTSWTLEEKDEHKFYRDGVFGSDVVSFTVPPGWKITSVMGLDSESISADNRTATGVAFVDTPYMITFSRPAAPPSIDWTRVGIATVLSAAAIGALLFYIKR